jgi:archaellum component FlaF (FlaF/FlaG flagellin family)
MNNFILSYSIFLSLLIFIFIRYAYVFYSYDRILNAARFYNNKVCIKSRDKIKPPICVVNKHTLAFSIWEWGYDSIFTDEDVYKKLKDLL